jgi:DNA invertase Pin-like site-specific DNA recombinase
MSADRTGQELGIERQREACQTLAAARGWDITAEYVDNGVSASKFGTRSRPQFEAMIRDRETFDAVLVWSVDRLYRRVTDLERLVEELGPIPVYGVVTGRVDLSTADGRLHARMLASVGAHESERKSERVRLAKQQARSRGEWLGRAPRGYTLVDGKLVVDPTWAPRVQEAFDKVLAGESLNSVARDWSVYASSIRKLLLSPALAGLTSDLRPGTWTPIVSESDWRAMHSLLNDRRRPDRMHPKKGNPSSLLGGVLRCPHGRAFKRVVDTYRINTVPCGCSISVEVTLADAYVTRWVLDELAKPEVREAFIVPEEGPDVKLMEDLRARRAALVQMIADGLVEEDEARSQLSHLKEELARLTMKTRPAIDLTGISGYPAMVWSKVPMTNRRSIIRYLTGGITVLPGRLPIDEKVLIANKA